MSYESYYQSGASFQKLMNDHRFKLYYLVFVLTMIVSAVVANAVGFPTVAGMLVSYIVLFTVVSVLTVFVPIAVIAKLF